MTVEELFAHSLVMSVDRRRLETMRLAFEREGLPMPRVIEGFQFRHIEDNKWWHAPGGRYTAVNCYASHIMFVKMAQFLGWPFVAIFEDDAWPRTGCREDLAKELAAAPDGGAFLLGWDRRRNGDVFCGTHSYVVFSDTYETFIAAHREELKDYAADMSFRYYAPLRRRLAFASKVLFCQINRRNDTWMYTRADQGWRGDPDPGFPRAEDVLPGGLLAEEASVRPVAAPADSEAVDVLYVVGPGARDIDNRPLRWSLRALARYGRNVGRVIVAGQPPPWLSDKAIALPIPDERGFRKQTNIALVAIKAARLAGLERAFLYSSDDHYLARSADLAAWPRYYTGEIASTAVDFIAETGRSPSAYERSLIATRLFLSSQGLPATRRACLHLDTWMDPAFLDRAEELVRRGARSSGIGLEPSCVFNALYEARGGGGHVLYRGDRKIRTAKDCDAKLAAGLPGFSTTPASERSASVVAWMSRHFPEPSPWERA